MAAPNLTNRFTILLGDGGEPETFSWPCGANSRNVSFKNNYDETTVLDCDDPLGEIASIVRSLESQDMSAEISGRLAKGAIFTEWRTWANSGETKNIRIMIDLPAADGGGYWTVPTVLTEFGLSSQGKTSVEFTASIVANGAPVWTAAT